MPPLMEQIRAYLRQFSMGQRVTLIVILLAVVSSLVVLSLWANRPEYSLLYSDMAPEDANEMITVLRDDGIPYRLEAGGRSVYIPGDQVAEYRITFAARGLATGSITGYELFDEQRMGMTTFMQRVNFQRALEGELTHTINQLEEIRLSRVHLVIPEKRFFEGGEEATAAIILHLKPGASLRRQQIRGIAMMVANSVPDLQQENVTIVDASGQLLTESITAGGPAPVGSLNWEIRQSVETQLQKKAQDLINDVLGPGKSVIKVSADLNFEQFEQTREIFDTENSAILSEERSIERFLGADTASRNIEQTVTNYELNKTVEHFVRASGEIRRLTVAVLVDGSYSMSTDANGDEILVYTPRTQVVLDQISALISSALGTDANRGDVVEVQNIQFNREEELANLASVRSGERQAFYGKIGTNLAIIGALIITVLMLMRMLGSTTSNIAHVFKPPPIRQVVVGAQEGVEAIPGATSAVEARGEMEMATDEFLQKLSPEARAQLEAMDKMTSDVVTFTEKNPEGAAQLLRIWTTGVPEED